MKARNLLKSMVGSKRTLSVLYDVLDQAWQEVEPSVPEGAREETRMRLAGIILLLARDETQSADQLKAAALSLMSADRA